MKHYILLILILTFSVISFGQSSETYNRQDKNGKGEITVKRIKKNKKMYLRFDAYAGGVERGTCVGQKQGLAEFITPTVAEFDKMEKVSGENQHCRLTFIFSKGLLIVRETDCSDYHGAACTFSGTYKRGKLK